LYTSIQTETQALNLAYSATTTTTTTPTPPPTTTAA